MNEKGVKKWLQSPYTFVAPYALLFILLIALPVLVAMFLSFTYFNTIQAPVFIGLKNYVDIFTGDSVFLQKALSNTILFSVVVGPIGYMLSFVLAWMLAQVPHKARTIYAVIIYSPSITGPIMMANVWRILFSGDETGHLNNLLMNVFGIIDTPIQFMQDADWLFPIMIVVSLWSSMGLGFLAMLAGVLNIDRSLYEAAAIDGMRNRWQEIFYITIPSMKPQMLFGAVMAIIGTFNSAGLAAALAGGTAPPQYAGWLIVDHANDFGFTRFEMGYASAITVILLLIVVMFNQISYKLFGERD
ncbi:carbohydrate ABC transporter permease [Candidatus Xianfuyuplasma coldseepsis]|uniref:Sugar ABC transporter permease n=1 Tax=Candidatus Xianfuyuplasma coldseepsis TaxID=2782163 RepID=A0A7L7KNI7_9MOLU|nr:sugar ABC transporter permease [Xianfuyuplasma coldseepsis]QMS84223.1 sugar ABC transporter permease [Xianfuyuplasma coldseepsis]